MFELRKNPLVSKGRLLESGLLNSSRKFTQQAIAKLRFVFKFNGQSMGTSQRQLKTRLSSFGPFINILSLHNWYCGSKMWSLCFTFTANFFYPCKLLIIIYIKSRNMCKYTTVVNTFSCYMSMIYKYNVRQYILRYFVKTFYFGIWLWIT